MSLDIYFREDIQDRLDSLCQANERLLTLVEALGADPRDISLIRSAIVGTLDDVSVSFGLHRRGTPLAIEKPKQPETTQLTVPARREVML